MVGGVSVPLENTSESSVVMLFRDAAAGSRRESGELPEAPFALEDGLDGGDGGSFLSFLDEKRPPKTGMVGRLG